MSLIPSLRPVIGSATSCAEHVPWPFWFVFTGSTTVSTLNVRHGGVDAVQPFVKVTTSVVASHTFVPFVSLKIAIVTVASVPRLMVLGKGKLGLMSIRCVQGNDVVGTPLASGVIVPPQSLPSPMPLASTSFLRKKSVSISVVASLPDGFDVRLLWLRPPAKSMAAENR